MWTNQYTVAGIVDDEQAEYFNGAKACAGLTLKTIKGVAFQANGDHYIVYK